MEKYERLERIGEGAYGQVYKGRNRQTHEIVAVKRVRIDDPDEGVPAATIREISSLKELQHRNIIRLIDVIHDGGNHLSLVFEYCSQDLKKYLESLGGRIDPDVVRSFMRQLLEGLQYCHNNHTLHRDLKPQNILVTKDNELKIADFGLARWVGAPVRYLSADVVTLWYRPPEVLLESNFYTNTVDMWSTGCIFAEIANAGVELFKGVDVEGQLKQIFSLLGTPADDAWPAMKKLPGYRKIERFPTYSGISPWTDIVPNLHPRGRDLLKAMVVCNPTLRISTDDALKHPYFRN